MHNTIQEPPPDYRKIVKGRVNFPGKDGIRVLDADTIVLIRRHLPRSRVEVSVVDSDNVAEDFRFEMPLDELEEIIDMQSNQNPTAV